MFYIVLENQKASKTLSGPLRFKVEDNSMTFQGFAQKFKDFTRLCKHCVKYSRTPVTRTLKGHEKQFELSGSTESLICRV